MPKKNTEFREEFDKTLQNIFTDSVVEKVMSVLIEKYDNGKAKSGYTYNNRRFIITLEEKKGEKKNND